MSNESQQRPELKPCPFCGLSDKLTFDNLGGLDDYCIECDRCRFGQHAVHTNAQAIVAWNTRFETDTEQRLTERDKMLEEAGHTQRVLIGELAASRELCGRMLVALKKAMPFAAKELECREASYFPDLNGEESEYIYEARQVVESLCDVFVEAEAMKRGA